MLKTTLQLFMNRNAVLIEHSCCYFPLLVSSRGHKNFSPWFITNVHLSTTRLWYVTVFLSPGVTCRLFKVNRSFRSEIYRMCFCFTAGIVIFDTSHFITISDRIFNVFFRIKISNIYFLLQIRTKLRQRPADVELDEEQRARTRSVLQVFDHKAKCWDTC